MRDEIFKKINEQTTISNIDTRNRLQNNHRRNKMAIYYGWIICVSCLVLFSTSTGILYGFSQMIIPMSKEFNASISALGWIGSLPCGVSLIAAPLTNYINRCLGTRTTVLTGISISSLALASAYMAEDVIGLLIFHGITNGIGILLALNPPFFLVGEYFPYKHRRYVFATSLIVCGFPLANLVFNPIVWALLSCLGWRRTYLVFAGMLFVIGGGSALTFRPCQPDELAEEMAKPENSGAVETRDRFDYQEIGIEESRRLGANQPDGEVTYTTAGKVFLLLVWLAASTFKAIGYFIPIFTLMKQMEVLGISTWRSSKVMILYAACELVSRLSMSLFGDNVKGKILQTYVICCLSLCLINIFGSSVSTFSGLLIFAADQGLASGPVVAVMYSCCAEVMNQQYVEELYSLFRTGLGIGSLIGLALADYIYDNTGSFRFVFYLTGALYAITGLLYALIIIINNRTENRCFFKTANHITSSASEELL